MPASKVPSSLPPIVENVETPGLKNEFTPSSVKELEGHSEAKLTLPSDDQGTKIDGLPN